MKRKSFAKGKHLQQFTEKKPEKNFVMSFALLFYWLFVSIVEEDNSDDEEIYRREKRSHSEVHSIMFLRNSI